MNNSLVKKGDIKRLLDLVLSTINTKYISCPRDNNIQNIMHINSQSLSLDYIKQNVKQYIYEHMAISKRIIENKETRKESRKYYVLRNIIRECFQRLVIEDFEYTLQEDLADYYVLTVVLDISGFHHTIQSISETDNLCDFYISFIRSQFQKVKLLCSTIMLHYGIDMTLFDGFHSPSLTEIQEKVIPLLSKIFILLECFDFEITYIEEGKVSHNVRIPYALQAVNFSPLNWFPHLFLGCAFNYIKNPLACIFHTFISLHLNHKSDQRPEIELCSYLAYYRSEYIRLRTNELSGIKDNEYLNQTHPLRVCRMYIYCFLHLVEIAVMKIGIHDADYLFQHLHKHFEEVLLSSCDVSKLSDNTLMYIILISILTIENTFEEEGKSSPLTLVSLEKEHKLCSYQLLWHVLSDFMKIYSTHSSMKSKLLLPILTGLYYLFSHKDLFSYTWISTSVYPISCSDFVNSIQSFINEIRSTDWTLFEFNNVKLLASYNSSDFPFAVTHLCSINCLEGMKKRLLQIYPSFLPFVQDIIAQFDCVMSSLTPEPEQSDSPQSEDDYDPISDFLSTMAEDIFCDSNEIDTTRDFLRLKKYRRRLQGRKTKERRQVIKQPQWRAQRFRKAIPPTKEEFKLLQEVNRTNINKSFIIVLDISNIAVNYGNKRYCCKGIKLAIDYFTSIGHKVIGFMHRKFIDGIKKRNPEYYERMTPDDIPYLQELVDKRIISTCPDYEDAYILQYAIEHRGIVVSNDLFRDFPKRYPEKLQPIMQRFLDTHVMHYAFTEDSFCPSKEFIYPDLIIDNESEEDTASRNVKNPTTNEGEEELQDYPDLDVRLSDERLYYYEYQDNEIT